MDPPRAFPAFDLPLYICTTGARLEDPYISGNTNETLPGRCRLEHRVETLAPRSRGIILSRDLNAPLSGGWLARFFDERQFASSSFSRISSESGPHIHCPHLPAPENYEDIQAARHCRDLLPSILG